MSESRPDKLTAVADELVAFRRQFESLVLATADDHGMPHASYAPFVRDPSGNFYVFVSALARHTAHLARGRAEILLIEDQALTPNPFARRRLTYQCTCEAVARGSEWDKVMTEFSHRFGHVVATLRQLPDFTLFRLTPGDGVYVKGFGQAFRIPGGDLARLVPLGAGGGADRSA